MLVSGWVLILKVTRPTLTLLLPYIASTQVSYLHLFFHFLSLSVGAMRPAENHLDLNNLPDDYAKHHLLHDDSSSSGGGGCSSRKKKGGGKEDGKVYECRFCSLKFCKSQALGGHMNRHRQERETETLNRARQLVFNNDNLAAQPNPHISSCHQPITTGSGGCYNNHPGGDPYRPLYPPRVFPAAGTSPTPAIPPPQPYPSRLSTYPVNDYYVGHVLGSSHYGAAAPDSAGSYTCVGAPVGYTGRDVDDGRWGTPRFQDY